MTRIQGCSDLNFKTTIQSYSDLNLIATNPGYSDLNPMTGIQGYFDQIDLKDYSELNPVKSSKSNLNLTAWEVPMPGMRSVESAPRARVERHKIPQRHLPTPEERAIRKHLNRYARQPAMMMTTMIEMST